MSEISRRQAMLGAAWSLPVVALAVAAPLAAASPTQHGIYCVTDDPDVESVTSANTTMLVHIRSGAQNAIDVTIRQQGYPEYHVNLIPPGTPTNGVGDQENYVPGEAFIIELWTPFRLDRDFMQVKTVHRENCVAIQ